MTNQPQGITLTAEEFAALDQMIGKLPTALGMPFVDFFRLIHQRRQQEKPKQVEAITNLATEE